MNHYLLAISVTRREIGVAIFRDIEIEYCCHRHLASEGQLAHRSIAGLIAQLHERYPADAAVVLKSDAATRASEQEATAFSTLQSMALSASTVTSDELLHSYAEPSLRAKSQLRAAVRTIWPALGDNRDGVVLDAVAAGFWAAVERVIRAQPDEILN